MPLHIFEERYRLLVRERRRFAVVLIRVGREAGPVPAIHEVGTVAELTDVEELPDGRFEVVAEGLHRVRLGRLDSSGPYLQAEAEELPEPRSEGTSGLRSRLQSYLTLHRDADWRRGARGPRLAPAWAVGSVLKAEPLKLQALLESGQPAFAEALLEQELERARRLGRTAPLAPCLPSSN